jgi:hypothetical protein
MQVAKKRYFHVKQQFRVKQIPALWAAGTTSREPPPPLQVTFRNDVVATVNRLGLVTGPLHRHGPRHALAVEIPHDCAAPVVKSLDCRCRL